MIKTYSELIRLSTFNERLEYLRLYGFVGADKFGYARGLNQEFYMSPEWRFIRNQIIMRDHWCDLGCPDHPITLGDETKNYRKKDIIVHHINPPTVEDYLNHAELLLDPENLICVTNKTHRFIHYGEVNASYTPEIAERRPNDTCPWKQAY